MSDVEITIRLAEELAREARESNLLTDRKIAELLQAELDRQTTRQDHLRAFLNLADQLSSAEPKVTPEEIAAEIEAVRNALLRQSRR
jgi:hypothetical protein